MKALLELEVVLNKEASYVYSSPLRPAKLFLTSFISKKNPLPIMIIVQNWWKINLATCLYE